MVASPLDKLTPTAMDAAVDHFARASQQPNFRDECLKYFFNAFKASPYANGLLKAQADALRVQPQFLQNAFLMGMVLGWDLRGNIQGAESLEAMLEH